MTEAESKRLAGLEAKVLGAACSWAGPYSENEEVPPVFSYEKTQTLVLAIRQLQKFVGTLR